MKYLKLFENFKDEDINEDDIIFMAETQRGKYKIVVYQSDYDKEHSSYSFKDYTNDKPRGGGARQTKLDMEAYLNNVFDGSSKIDSINYIVKINKHDFRILSVGKDEPLGTERYFKHLLSAVDLNPDVPKQLIPADPNSEIQ